MQINPKSPTERSELSMQYTKTCYICRNSWYGILILVIVACPLFSMADQHDTGSESQTSVDGQNQVSSALTQRDISNTFTFMLNEQEKMFMTRYTVSLVVSGILFLGILILLIYTLRQHRSFKQRLQHLDGLIGKIRTHLEISRNASDNSSDTGTLVQGLTEIAENLREPSFDLEPLHQTLIAGTETLNHIADILQNQVPTQHADIEEFSQPFENESSNQLPPILQKFCELYNAGAENELRDSYQPHHPIGVTNATERHERQSELPIFQTNTAGDFVAYSIDSEDFYAVVPFYGLVLQDSLYGPGALGYVFECPGFDPLYSYQIKVIRPAVFELDSVNQRWTLQEKGELELEATL